MVVLFSLNRQQSTSSNDNSYTPSKVPSSEVRNRASAELAKGDRMSRRSGASAPATPETSESASLPAGERVTDPVREEFAPMIQGMDALNAAKTLKASGYLNYAREYAQKAVAENPESFEALLLLGQLLPHDGNDRATTFRRLVEMDPTSVGALYGLGQTLYLSDHPEEAIPYLEKVVKMDPSNGSGYHVLGKSYEKMGRYDEALAAYKKAYEINKGSVTLMHIQAIEEGHPRFKPVQRESQGRLLEESPPEETSPEIPPQDEAPSTPDKAEKLPRETESVDKPMMEADESENKGNYSGCISVVKGMNGWPRSAFSMARTTLRPCLRTVEM